jgi:anti-sigma regulatory factor (Ser/Thr protein kinase)
VESAELMTSELATNCIRHARSGFEVAISVDRAVTVEVCDTGVGRPVLGTPTLTSVSGRGLYLVSRLAKDWGTVHRSKGNTVWFTLADPMS